MHRARSWTDTPLAGADRHSPRDRGGREAARSLLGRLLALVLLGCVFPSAWAVQQIVGLGNLDFGVWSPTTGSTSTSDDFCVASRLGNSQNPGRYAARVSPLVGSTYVLRGVSDPGTEIPATFVFQDLTDNVQSPLVPNVFTAREQAGVRTCTGINNARLIASVQPADIATAAPGDYQATFTFTGRGIPSNTELSRTFTVRLRVPELIRISGLDSIDLGAFDGVNDNQGGDDFCVYSNGVTGRYTVTPSGQGAGGAFEVRSDTGRMPVFVEYDDGAGFVPLTSNAPALKANARRDSVNCIGGNNARLRVTVSTTDMATAPSGIYAGEIVLLVAPQ